MSDYKARRPTQAPNPILRKSPAIFIYGHATALPRKWGCVHPASTCPLGTALCIAFDPRLPVVVTSACRQPSHMPINLVGAMGHSRQIRTVPHNPARARDSTNVRTILSPGQMDFAVGIKERRTAVVAVPSEHQGCCYLNRPVEIVCGDHPYDGRRTCDGRRKTKRQLRNRPRSLQRTHTATRRVAPSWRLLPVADGGSHDAPPGLGWEPVVASRCYL